MFSNLISECGCSRHVCREVPEQPDGAVRHAGGGPDQAQPHAAHPVQAGPRHRSPVLPGVAPEPKIGSIQVKWLNLTNGVVVQIIGQKWGHNG